MHEFCGIWEDLQKTKAYQKSCELSEVAWEEMMKWDWFERKALGLQFIRAIDSISANIAEAYGRHSFKDKLRFYHYARGSNIEALSWLEKARTRVLKDQNAYIKMSNSLHSIPYYIHVLMQNTKNQINKP